MTEDHYVARTYLKHFGDPMLQGRLHGYHKPSGNHFTCWPKDVCREWDGDINPSLKNPGLLGDYRDLFEPHWNLSIAQIESGSLRKEDRWAIAGYMANLMTCVPAWVRVNQHSIVDMKGTLVRESLRADMIQGVELSEVQQKLLAFLESGSRIPVDPHEAKAHAIQDLADHAWRAYNADWIVLHNDSQQPFITSDNPLAFSWSGRVGEPVRRYLPVNPAFCIGVTFDPARHDDRKLTVQLLEQDLKAASRGVVRPMSARPIEVREINKLIVQCAEGQIFSSKAFDQLPHLIRKYGRYRLESEGFEGPGPGGLHIGTRYVVRERRPN
jgi:Protein of unknown function (DUF4238)